MDVHAIRLAIAEICQGIGYNAKHYVPEDAVSYPAAIVGIPRAIDYGESLGLALVTLPVHVACSAASLQDAQRRLDEAVSTTGERSVRAALHEATNDAWSSIKVLGVEEARLISDGQAQSLAMDVMVEVRARK